jgi:hypothetical protein
MDKFGAFRPCVCPCDKPCAVQTRIKCDVCGAPTCVRCVDNVQHRVQAHMLMTCGQCSNEAGSIITMGPHCEGRKGLLERCNKARKIFDDYFSTADEAPSNRMLYFLQTVEDLGRELEMGIIPSYYDVNEAEMNISSDIKARKQ